MSNKAIDKNNVPENVIAMFIILPYVKHFKLEINLPNITTYEKNTNINISFINNTIYMTDRLVSIRLKDL